MYKNFLVMFFLFLLFTPSFGKVKIFIDEDATDSVGRSLLYKFKEEIRKSKHYTIGDNKGIRLIDELPRSKLRGIKTF